MKGLSKLKGIKIRDYMDEMILAICFLLVVIVAFEAGMLIYKNKIHNDPQTQSVDLERERLNAEILRLSNLIAMKEQELANLEVQNDDFAEKQQALLESIRSLRGQVANISGEQAKKYPFIVPTNGITGSIHGTFDGDLYGMKHLGVDIWTTAANGGRISTHKGNEIVAACSGKVVTLTPENGAITIQCDEIPSEYDVPAHKVFTHYSHMGHAETKELYYTVEKNQRVKAGERIGVQGDLSSFFPEMRNVHLHFSVFTGKGETDENGGAINPCLYIGGECQKEGVVFVKGN